jgi:hypothetical protein
MLDIRLWQHKTSGEVYAALNGFDDDPDLAEHIDQHQFDYRELEQPHRGVLQADLE